MNKLTEFGKKIGIKFNNQNLIQQAFVHRSYLNESKKFSTSNERLEFLGDSILSFLVSEHLYTQYSKLAEGELTNLRSSVVRTTALAKMAKQLDLGQLLLLSRGEEESGGRNNPSILADTVEAFLAAFYLDQGILAVKKILNNLLFSLIPKILAEKTYKDTKSTFQEIVQEETKNSPIYKVLQEEGPDHAKEFTVGVYVDGTLWGAGSGRSKQEAETNASRAAIEKWKRR